MPSALFSDYHDKASPQLLKMTIQPQRNTEFGTLALLRDAYPKYHITETSPELCDLLGYAEADHATAAHEDTPFDHFIRSYNAPESRLEKFKGKVTNDVRFGCWRYNWRGTDFLVYKAMYVSRWGHKKLLYVLHPHGPQKLTNDATDALLLERGRWSKDLHREIYVFDNAEWKKSKELWKSVEGSSWDDVILEASMKEKLIHDVQDFFNTRKLYQMSNVPWKRGVILHGIPGNGKTVSVKALINSLAKREGDPIPSLYVISLDSCAGPKYSIQLIFKQARSMAPCLLTRSYFLNEVDGLESNDGIPMIGSTNYLDRLDAAIIKRPSRFDRKYHFKLPDEQTRLAYALYWSRKFAGANEVVDFPESLCPLIGNATDSFSFAYMKELFIAASPAASDDPIIVKGKDDGETAVGKGSPQPTKKIRSVLGEIPDDLKGNALLRVVLAQAVILLREMESTDGAEPAPMSCELDDSCDDPPPFSVGWFQKKFSETG
ncbi:P-loop containing nucleoside triphosphate hydrolase protein [Podospora didyma]|uniref:P-loop containing nucleoside triphosphate hydrolase protein n=1 Tax=Podospora didyma TaxID=330526 RepID=A0AAE0NNN1_9PEZI|nr:P-loop containing nucleoside triphosphate hydrolase protein [Podospora didyma]